MSAFIKRLACFAAITALGANANALEFSDAERAMIAQHGPWPPTLPRDGSNAASENEAAIRLGEMLFFDHALGNDSRLSCASCHDPGLAFSDGRATGQGRRPLARNTPSLLNLKGNRWFGFGGEHDSLWAQSIRPIIAAREMASSATQVSELLRGRDRYRQYYRTAFGATAQAHAPEQVLVNVGKALAAYQETLLSPRSAFDDFRDALLTGDQAASEHYPQGAQRGLKIFIGAGRCNLCHAGPKFSSGEFANTGIPATNADSGRLRGIERLRANPYNLLGKYNDGDAQQNAVKTRQARPSDRDRGAFKIPGLRGVAATSPYMHDGSIATLRDVVRHYATLDAKRLPAGDAGMLRPLNLSETEIDDLVSFLESLGEE
ncbi:MAG: hypothetical protein OER87_07755 [Gammaproteobacteria bacterium]|nr:hypothetical protein [Gammaproteobacteria bacterium]